MKNGFLFASRLKLLKPRLPIGRLKRIARLSYLSELQRKVLGISGSINVQTCERGSILQIKLPTMNNTGFPCFFKWDAHCRLENYPCSCHANAGEEGEEC